MPTFPGTGFWIQFWTLLWRDSVLAVRDPTLYYLQVKDTSPVASPASCAVHQCVSVLQVCLFPSMLPTAGWRASRVPPLAVGAARPVRDTHRSDILGHPDQARRHGCADGLLLHLGHHAPVVHPRLQGESRERRRELHSRVMNIGYSCSSSRRRWQCLPREPLSKSFRVNADHRVSKRRRLAWMLRSGVRIP